MSLSVHALTAASCEVLKLMNRRLSPWFAVWLIGIVTTAVLLEWLASSGAIADSVMRAWLYPTIGVLSWIWIAVLIVVVIRNRMSQL